jgi:hypothetical protein
VVLIAISSAGLPLYLDVRLLLVSIIFSSYFDIYYSENPLSLSELVFPHLFWQPYRAPKLGGVDVDVKILQVQPDSIDVQDY